MEKNPGQANDPCVGYWELISAELDGELTMAETSVLSDHLMTCADCTDLQATLTTQHRMVRIGNADTVPDLTPNVLAVAHPPRIGRRGWVRQSLAVIGLTELIIALPALILGEDSDAPIHVARHIGSLGAALGFALLYVAWKPTRAYGLLPFVASLAGFMSLASFFDLAFGRASFATESTHLVEFTGMFLVWLLSGSPRPRIPRFSRLVHKFG
jgi:predicted anti-sigma-YlaC factor YlaD